MPRINRTVQQWIAIAALLCLTSLPAHATNTVFTTPGSNSFTVPAGVTSIQCDVIGAGGDAWYSGGGGGAWSETTSLSVSPGGTVFYHVGQAATGASGEDSWVNKTTNAAPASTTDGCLAKGGQFQMGDGPSQGGQASSGVGNSKFSGGNGGDPGTSAHNFGTAGGGAAGPNGVGGNGGKGDVNTGFQGGSGGGANGGANGTDSNFTTAGATGANNRLGAGAGTAGTAVAAPGAGTNGGSSGGGFIGGQTSPNASFEAIAAWGGTVGPGAGMSGADNVGTGIYGSGQAFYSSSSGIPGNGLVVLTYTASGGTTNKLPLYVNSIP